MKKLLSLILIGCLVGVTLYGGQTSAAIPNSCTLERFKVTAYYSPLPDQAFYNTNSFAEEIRLNGKGTHGASGRGVFPGMIAASPSYEFGTQIVFGGWGIGQVEDRGQAIVNAGERTDAPLDRIDFRVGQGHGGLRRALSFGVQYLDGWVCPEGTYPESDLGFDYDAFPYYTDFFQRMIHIIGMRPGRNDLMAKTLQKYLSGLGYLSTEDVTGYYGPQTTQAVCKLQQDYLGLPVNHEACGWYGPLTRGVMGRLIKSRGLTISTEAQVVDQSEEVLTQETVITSHADDMVVVSPPAYQESPLSVGHLEAMFTHGEFKDYQFTRPFIPGEASKEVRVLQRKLQYLGYHDGEVISGVYDQDTINALYTLQLDHGLLDGSEDAGLRGYFGPGTRGVVNGM